MTNSSVIIVDIDGIETHNEKSARDKGVKWVRSRLRPGVCFPVRSTQAKRTAAHRGLARMVVQAKTTMAQRETLAYGCAIKLVRIAPRLLFDVSESCPSALAAVRDGVADALGLDDRDASTGGLIAWSYAQERGPYGVRVEMQPADVTKVRDPVWLPGSRLRA